MTNVELGAAVMTVSAETIAEAIREEVGKKVTKLRLKGKSITDVSALSGLTNLEKLYLASNKLTEFPTPHLSTAKIITTLLFEIPISHSISRENVSEKVLERHCRKLAPVTFAGWNRPSERKIQPSKLHSIRGARCESQSM